MTLNTRSQLGQDIEVANFFQNRRGGYFIEVGAYNGIDLSNTYALEKELDWKGICVEPLPDMFTLLQQNRSCACVKVAAYDISGLELEFVNSEMMSGIVKNIDKHTHVLNNAKFKVQTKTLTEIMDENNAPPFIEYLSIDTEGSELEVLRGIDWNRYSFGYISIEHNYVEPRRTEMRRFLEGLGYTYLRENHWDDDYIRRVEVNKTYAKSCFSSNHYLNHNNKRQEHLAGLGLNLSNQDVLEVGAGTGDHTGLFLNQNCKVMITEARSELLDLLRERFSGNPNATISFLNMENPTLKFVQKFDIVYCYGLLYHLKNPETAIKYMAENCSDKLLLETCVSFGQHLDPGLCAENVADPTQSFSGGACRPTRPWIVNELKKYFKYVYFPITQPNHAEFPLNWNSPPPSGTLSRAVFIASHNPIENNLLSTDMPMQQSY